MIRPRRSLLFMPGSNARALEKARNLPADGIILDLEDSVAPDAKAVARDQIAKAIAAGGFGKREVLIRVNSLDTPWWVDDVTMAGKARPDGILVPKVSTVADLNAIANRLSDINADMSIRVWAMIETARAVLDADKLAAASKDSETRLAGFVFGPNDISRETRIRMQPGRAAMIPMITHCILATRAHGLEILDGPYGDISNIDGFAVECAQGRDLGFDGKTLIHPGQVAVAILSARFQKRAKVFVNSSAIQKLRPSLQAPRGLVVGVGEEGGELRLRPRHEFEGGLRDDPERSLVTHEEVLELVAGRRLARLLSAAVADADDLAGR